MRGYYYRSFVYSKLCEQSQLKKAYRKGVMVVIMEQFIKCAFNITNKIKYGKSVEWTIRIVLSSFCCMQYIIHSFYLQGIELKTW